MDEAATKTGRIGLVLVPWTTNVAFGVVLPIPTLWLLVTRRTETPELDATLKMSLLPAVPCMLKLTVELVAFTPATVPLSLKAPWVRELVPFHMETKPGLPLPMVVR